MYTARITLRPSGRSLVNRCQTIMTIGTNDTRSRRLHIRRFISYVTFHPATFAPAIKGPSTQRSAVSNAFVVLNVHKIIQSPQIAPASLEISPWYISRSISWHVSVIGLQSLTYSLISGELPTPRYSWLRIGARLIELDAVSVGLMLPVVVPSRSPWIFKRYR